MSGDFNYERIEIDRALDSTPGDGVLKLKVLGEGAGESRWLLASPAQVRAIREVLAGDALAVLEEALGDALAYRDDDPDDEAICERYRAVAEAMGLDPFPA